MLTCDGCSCFCYGRDAVVFLCCDTSAWFVYDVAASLGCEIIASLVCDVTDPLVCDASGWQRLRVDRLAGLRCADFDHDASVWPKNANLGTITEKVNFFSQIVR